MGGMRSANEDNVQVARAVIVGGIGGEFDAGPWSRKDSKRGSIVTISAKYSVERLPKISIPTISLSWTASSITPIRRDLRLAAEVMARLLFIYLKIRDAITECWFYLMTRSGPTTSRPRPPDMAD
ncbi:hypothetical protein HZ326_28328 [Fusarium oxysporum f. sp. albedinis]|nr:hypothetical protein HZ326_28328 [Fusarium oxysporum f. sp. albedinis]